MAREISLKDPPLDLAGYRDYWIGGLLKQLVELHMFVPTAPAPDLAQELEALLARSWAQRAESMAQSLRYIADIVKL